jgi:hypothetical protein
MKAIKVCCRREFLLQFVDKSFDMVPIDYPDVDRNFPETLFPVFLP